MSDVPAPGTVARPHGPFDTDREAGHAARTLGGPLRDGWSILSAEQNRQLLTQASDSAGVALGAYDQRILAWLAGFEDSTCAVVAGLIARAHQATAPTPGQLRTMLSALDVAADAKRDAAGACGDCDARPDGALCGTCEWRLAVADDYDALAEQLRERL